MTGYLETLTDPSYEGEIVIQTFPTIGNYVVIPEDFESPRPRLSAYIVRELCDEPSNFRCQGKLDDYLKAQGIPCLTGVDTRALLTDMSVPLGLTAGNALEVRESVEVLAGGGPADVVDLTVALAREMLDAAGRPDADPAAALADGRAMDVWRRMIAAQGGDPDADLPRAKHTEQVVAQADGVLTELDALAVGVAAWRLGAGRARKEDPVQAGAGVELHARPGDTVRRGRPLLTLHTDTPERFERAREALDGAITVAPEGSRPAGPAGASGATGVVLERITA